MHNLKSNCHTHTKYCDGKNTAEEMIEAAIELGFVSLGFSGHGPMNYRDCWEMTADGLEKYYKEIRELKDKYADKIDVVLGIELDSDFKFDKEYTFEYILSSVHQIHKNGKTYSIDYNAEELTRCVDNEYNGDWNKMAMEYFNGFAEFVISTKTDVVGHFDLITKFNKGYVLFDEGNKEYQKFALDAVDRILSAKPGIIFEVNTGAMFRCGNDKPYPADFILKRIREKGGRVTVTSDSHQTDSLDYAFDKAVAYCKDCGFKEVWYVTSGGFKAQKI